MLRRGIRHTSGEGDFPWATAEGSPSPAIPRSCFSPSQSVGRLLPGRRRTKGAPHSAGGVFGQEGGGRGGGIIDPFSFSLSFSIWSQVNSSEGKGDNRPSISSWFALHRCSCTNNRGPVLSGAAKGKSDSRRKHHWQSESETAEVAYTANGRSRPRSLSKTTATMSPLQCPRPPSGASR